MTIQEMKDIILQEELESYSRFSFGTRYTGAQGISMNRLPDGQYEICITGERGKHTIQILAEGEACEKVIDYLRFGKEMQEKYGFPW